MVASVDRREPLMPSLRQLGYQIRPPRIGTALSRLERAGIRYRALNRVEPSRGHYIGDCPVCGRTDALWIEPGGLEFSTLCGCGEGDSIDLAFLLRAAA